MAVLAAVASVVWSFLFTPFLLFILCIIFLASIGKSLGVRRLYVNILLKLFEYGRQHIEVAEELKRLDSDDESSEEEEKIKKEGGVVIQRQNLLVPDRGLAGPLRQGNGQAKPPADDEGQSKAPEGKAAAAEGGEGDATKGEGGETQEQETDGINWNENYQLDFQLSSALDYIRAGMEAIIEDQVTSVFEAEELRSWNLLTRTNRQYEFVSWRLTVIWAMGFFVRYCFLLPLRILICFIGVVSLIVCMWVAGCIRNGEWRRWLGRRLCMPCFALLTRSLSAVITYHGTPPGHGICVANHTSPIDVLILMCDNTYSLIGQVHGGFLGMLERALVRASPHIFFERFEARDRIAVTNRLREHVSDPKNPPILIFPEGTCINNTSVMQFKKGSFEVGGTIYPVAIKYDPRFGDAFWNSSRYNMLQHLYLMMTSWAIVCDVWYLPPMQRMPHESSVQFANRVKGVIARRGGLVDLVWDGQLKRMKAKKEWKELQQEDFSRRLKGE